MCLSSNRSFKGGEQEGEVLLRGEGEIRQRNPSAYRGTRKDSRSKSGGAKVVMTSNARIKFSE